MTCQILERSRPKESDERAERRETRGHNPNVDFDASPETSVDEIPRQIWGRSIEMGQVIQADDGDDNDERAEHEDAGQHDLLR